jgi:pimeloyl-ACP methyl ester carboxylesterase
VNSLDSDFLSHGVRCAGTLHLPAGDQSPPVVILAHGFGAIRAAGLHPFAERFVAAGYAAFLFDYRGFGDSGGEPRQWVSPRRHLQDWSAALAHVRTLPHVDTRRIVLWGTSFSGGHVLRTAADDGDVRAIIAQVPHVSGPASLSQTPLWSALRLAAAGLHDLVGGWFGRPYYQPIVGYPGELAALSSAECWDGYMGILPEGACWENRTRARIFLEAPLYSPIRCVHRIQSPTLIIAGRYDSVTPADAAREAAQRIPNGRFALLDCNHFQPYLGDAFTENIALQLAFLQDVVPARQRAECSTTGPRVRSGVQAPPSGR